MADAAFNTPVECEWSSAFSGVRGGAAALACTNDVGVATLCALLRSAAHRLGTHKQLDLKLASAAQRRCIGALYGVATRARVPRNWCWRQRWRCISCSSFRWRAAPSLCRLSRCWRGSSPSRATRRRRATSGTSCTRASSAPSRWRCSSSSTARCRSLATAASCWCGATRCRRDAVAGADRAERADDVCGARRLAAPAVGGPVRLAVCAAGVWRGALVWLVALGRAPVRVRQPHGAAARRARRAGRRDRAVCGARRGAGRPRSACRRAGS